MPSPTVRGADRPRRRKDKNTMGPPRPPSSTHAIPRGRWCEPGTPTFELLFPEIARRSNAGLIDAAGARQLAMRGLRAIVKRILERSGRADADTIEDCLQDLLVRLARMNVPERYDPEKAAPLTFVDGVARFVVHEAVFRRKPPRPQGGEALEPLGVDGDQLARLERQELLDELTALMEQLSDGERRALQEHYPLPDDVQVEPAPRKRRRRGTSPDALPRAVDVIERLRRLAGNT
jgi:DNA-directed RNA polymerase specialized sigma24 family protein